MFAIVGESLIRYTEEVVLPRIDASLAELDAAAARPREPAAAGALRRDAAEHPLALTGAAASS
jgi:hypothetical protein